MHTLPGWVSSKAVRTSTATPTRYGSVDGSMRPTNVSSLQAIWRLEAKLEPQFTCVHCKQSAAPSILNSHSPPKQITCWRVLVIHGTWRSRSVTVGHGRVPLLFHSGVSCGHGWSRLVTVGHGRVPLLFHSGVSCGHGWSRLVTVSHGQRLKLNMNPRVSKLGLNPQKLDHP